MMMVLRMCKSPLFKVKYSLDRLNSQLAVSWKINIEIRLYYEEAKRINVLVDECLSLFNELQKKYKDFPGFAVFVLMLYYVLSCLEPIPKRCATYSPSACVLLSAFTVRCTGVCPELQENKRHAHYQHGYLHHHDINLNTEKYCCLDRALIT